MNCSYWFNKAIKLFISIFSKKYQNTDSLCFILTLTVCKNLSKTSHNVTCFIVHFSSMFEKHALIVFPSNLLDKYSSWWFDVLWKSESFQVNFCGIFCNGLFTNLLCHYGNYYYY